MSKRRFVELTFNGICPPGANFAISSGSITFPFRVVYAKMIFTDEANNWIRHYWYVVGAPVQGALGDVSGDNPFSTGSPLSYFIGKGIEKTANTSREYTDVPAFITLFTQSASPYAYVINASIIIQEL